MTKTSKIQLFIMNNTTGPPESYFGTPVQSIDTSGMHLSSMVDPSSPFPFYPAQMPLLSSPLASHTQHTQESLPYAIHHPLGSSTPSQHQIQHTPVVHHPIPEPMHAPSTPHRHSVIAQEDLPGLHEQGNFFVDGNGVRTSPRKKDRHGTQAAIKSPLTTPAKATTPVNSQVALRGGGKGRGGRGSRSGANARKGGVSDDEIQKLGKTEKKAAEIVMPKKRMVWDTEKTMQVVEYIILPERWGRMTVNLKQYCTEVCYKSVIINMLSILIHCLQISQRLFGGEITSSQVHDRWTNIFRLYKDTKRHLSHTGGGDGDAPTEGSDLITDFENEAVNNGSDAKADPLQAKSEASARRYSSAAMDRFAQSRVFEAIDKVYVPLIYRLKSS